MTFRERLREQIEYNGLLDKEVAARAGISKRTLDSYVGAEACMPSAEVAVRLAKALSVSVEYLVTGETTGLAADSEMYIINQASKQNVRNLLHHFMKLSTRDQGLLVAFAETMLHAG